MAAVILQRRMERTVASSKPLLGAAKQAFRSYVRAYATHSSDSRSSFLELSESINNLNIVQILLGEYFVCKVYI